MLVAPLLNLPMTLEERLTLAREIAARTTPRFVVDNSREEARQQAFAETKRRTEALGLEQDAEAIISTAHCGGKLSEAVPR